MRDDLLSRAFRIADPKAAAAFSDPLRRRVTLFLAERELSVGELASVTGVESKRLHYHVAALRKLGLIVVSGQRARAGRPVKLYRAIAPAFFVPVDFIAVSPGAVKEAEMRDTLARLADPSREGMLYHVRDGEIRMQPVGSTKSGRTPAADCWRMVQLSSAQASRLAAAVDECLQAAAKNSPAATHTYLVHFALAPRLNR